MFAVDVMSREPVYEQIIRQVERMVLLGLMQPGDQMPSVRALSVELSVNPNTIQKAYGELDNRGVLQSVPGRGCFVAADAVCRLREQKRTELSGLRAALRELKLAGVTRDEINILVEEIYKEEKGDL